VAVKIMDNERVPLQDVKKVPIAALRLDDRAHSEAQMRSLHLRTCRKYTSIKLCNTGTL
jgi:hypothetical protein